MKDFLSKSTTTIITRMLGYEDKTSPFSSEIIISNTENDPNNIPEAISKIFHKTSNETSPSIPRIPHKILTKNKAWIEKEVVDPLNELQDILNGDKESLGENILERLVYKILNVDIDFVSFGRPERSGFHNKNDPHYNPYLSFFCYYGLEAHPTGIAEFDVMYKDILLTLNRLAHTGDRNDFLIYETLCNVRIIIDKYYKTTSYPMSTETKKLLLQFE